MEAALPFFDAIAAWPPLHVTWIGGSTTGFSFEVLGYNSGESLAAMFCSQRYKSEFRIFVLFHNSDQGLNV